MVARPKPEGAENSSHWYEVSVPGTARLSSVVEVAIVAGGTSAAVGTATPTLISVAVGGSKKSGTSPQAHEGSPAKYSPVVTGAIWRVGGGGAVFTRSSRSMTIWPSTSRMGR